MFIHRVAAALSRQKVPFAVAGGYAVALHGAVRGTVDVDVIISLRKGDFIRAERAFKAMGLAPRLPVSARELFDFRKEYVKNKHLVAWGFSNPLNPAEIVDVIITQDLRKQRIKKIKAAGRALPVLALPDLIKMKKISGRPQDREDIKALEALNQ